MFKPRTFTGKQESKLIFDSVEESARRWAKQMDVEADTLSEWVKATIWQTDVFWYSTEPCHAGMNQCLTIQTFLLN